jgi:hypothetical protein
MIEQIKSALCPGQTADATAIPPAAQADPEQIKTVTLLMRKHLGEFDAAACDCLENNRDMFRAIFATADFAQFEKHVQNFAFAEALSLLEKTASAPNASGQAV